MAESSLLGADLRPQSPAPPTFGATAVPSQRRTSRLRMRRPVPPRIASARSQSGRLVSHPPLRAGRTRRSAFLEGAGRARRSAAPGSARLRSGHCRSFKFGSPRFAQDVFADSVAAPSERSGLRSRVHGGRGIGDAPNAAGALPSRGARPQVKARRPAALAA